MAFTTKELSRKTFPDFENLAMKQGECWCIYYQRERPLGRSVPDEEKGAVNRRDKEKLVEKGKAHAVLVFDGPEPAGWCQYGTKEELPRIDRGREYRKVSERVEGKLWRITCFFVAREFRGRGVAKAGLKGALESIAKKGGGVVEAYPVTSKKMAAVPEWTWFGVPSMFEDEGFRRVVPLGMSRVLMRKKVAPALAASSRARRGGSSR